MTREEFAARLRAARENSGRTQAEAATVIGIHRVTYVRYESGEREPGVVLAVAIVLRLGLDPSEVFPEFFPEDPAR